MGAASQIDTSAIFEQGQVRKKFPFGSGYGKPTISNNPSGVSEIRISRLIIKLQFDEKILSPIAFFNASIRQA